MIRIANAGDAATVVNLVAAFREHLGQTIPTDPDLTRSIAVLLRDPETEFFLASDPADAAVGYVQCRYRHSAWVSACEAEIEDLFVIVPARRQGTGRRLMAFAIDRAVARGCGSIGLNTNERNGPALALYRTLGFSFERSHWQGGRQLWLQRRLGA